MADEHKAGTGETDDPTSPSIAGKMDKAMKRADGDTVSDQDFIDGKLQYLFNTRNKLYLIDRNGNAVDRFPVNLRVPASAGMALFDYDNSGDFRIPVPAIDKNIYMYDKQGNIVSGWNSVKADFEITHSLQHIRIGDRDYIVGNDMVRLYILNRRGRTRIRLNQQIEHSENNPVYFDPLTPSGDSRLVGTNRNGEVFYFTFDGKVSKGFKTDAGEEHFFVLSDLNGDRQNEYIFVDGQRLMVYDHDGGLLFDESYPEEIIYRPVIYEFSPADKKIGIVGGRSGRIYLVNNDGSLYQGFPLQGVSLFSISSFPELKDRFNLIVGNKDNFLYNYSVK